MIGDKILIKLIHRKKAKKLLKDVMDNYYHVKMIVAIGGQAGTGKTEASYLLQEHLWHKHKVSSIVLSVDNYYKTMWQDRNKIRQQKGIKSVGISEIDWKILYPITTIFRSKNKYLNIQKIHKYTNTLEKTVIDNKAVDILIIEGLYACWLRDIDLSIFLEGDIKDTKQFREERLKEKQTPFRMKVLRKEAKEVERTKKNANIIVSFKL